MIQIDFAVTALALSVVACAPLDSVRVSESSLTISDRAAPAQDSAVLALVSPYRSRMQVEMNEVIGNLEVTLHKGSPESALGNMVADILFAEAEKRLDRTLDFAIANSGGLRIPELPAGPITRGEIYELLPFDNRVVVVTLTGKTVQQLAGHIASRGGWPVSSAFRMKIEGDKATGVEIDGQPVDPEKSYQVVMPDYVANGGDDSFFLVDAPQEDTGAFMRDVVIAYIKEKSAAGGRLRFAVDGRIQRVP